MFNLIVKGPRGEDGAAGAQGEQGIQGDQGIQGEQGEVGSWPGVGSCAGRIRISGAHDIANASWTKVAFDTVVFDKGSDFNLDSDRFIVPTTGYYFLSACCLYNPNMGQGQNLGLAFYLNSTSYHYQTFIASGKADTSPSACCCGLMYLTAGDYVEVRAYHNQGTTRQMYGGEPHNGFSWCLLFT